MHITLSLQVLSAGLWCKLVTAFMLPSSKNQKTEIAICADEERTALASVSCKFMRFAARVDERVKLTAGASGK